MPSDVVIRAVGLGKKYLISHQAERGNYTSLRDTIARSAQNMTRALNFMRRRATRGAVDTIEEFWALKDLNFEIHRGDVVGVIGRNGAGKSTLLKVLSRITEPSEGRVEIRGRVASLLEVGTGFHPELSGRENIFLNGSILGMTREEIKRKFDEIVAFSEIEKFLDTPVKRYSSGMYVRLAFAVAAHLDPEILIVDEVLAVGDAEFQKKCLGKMRDVAKADRTVLFVSHNMSAVNALCSTALIMSKGTIAAAGPAPEMTSLAIEMMTGALDAPSEALRSAGPHVSIGRVTFDFVESGPDARCGIKIPLFAGRETRISELALLFYDRGGQRLAILDVRDTNAVPALLKDGANLLALQIHRLPLVEGIYSVGLYIAVDGYRGDLLDLESLVVPALNTRRPSGFAPYSAGVRGTIELSADARFETINSPADRVQV